MPIRVLPDQLAAQIAAGEVIERPASVVKELIENAIDSAAHDVRVEVRDGGKRLIRVGDDGSGIRRDEAELAFVHHATSKLQSADDLFSIHSLGFRGEALPSIAAVARVTMLTRAADEDVGTELKLESGRITGSSSHAAPPGTIITVENLFYNLPARLKFLKSTSTESAHIHELVNRYALAYSHVRFTLHSEGRLAFQSAGNGKMADVLVAVYGSETAKQMLEIESTSTASHPSGVAVEGFVSNPSLTRANRAQMVLFVNGRAVQDRNLLFAVSDAYRTFLQVARYPLCILKISVPPERVDVNVHPTKAEVRFRDGHAVFSAVQRAVRNTLLAKVSSETWELTVGSREPFTVQLEDREQMPMHMRLAPRRGDEFDPASLPGASRLPPPIASLRPPAEPTEQTNQGAGSNGNDLRAPLPMLRVLGQVARTYIVAEAPEGIYLIDQHAAHERVLYEKFMQERALDQNGASAQPLLEPLGLELTARQAARLDDSMEVFKLAGFDLEPFGGTTYLLRAVPSIMVEGDPRRAVTIILDELAGEDEGARDPQADPLHARREALVVASVCKQAAIKAGRALSLPEMQALIEQLEQSESPRTCPHGRPTMIRLGLDHLAREFGRQ